MKNCYLTWFSRIGFLGILINLGFVIPSFLMPGMLQSMMGLPFDASHEWMQNAGMLVAAVSLFYIPALVNPAKYPIYAWLVAISRLIAGVFWIYLVNTSAFPDAFKPMMWVDSSLGIILSTLLILGLGNERGAFFKALGTFLTAPFRWFASRWQQSLGFKITSSLSILILSFLGFETWNNLLRKHPDTVYQDDADQYKYGAIGLGMQARIPLYLFQALPNIFGDKLPDPEKGYASLGLIYEEGKDLPIGLAERHIGYKSVEPNCALCHTGSYVDENTNKRIPILGGPAHEFDLEKFQWFLYDCANDERFTADILMPEIEKIADLTASEKLYYRYAIIPFAKEALRQQGKDYAWQKSRPEQGRGRTDTFNPTKINVFKFPDDHTIGTVDLPQVWNQKPREGMWLHWDGNNDEIRERNYAAAMAVGATQTSVIPDNFKRVTDYLLTLQPPAFPGSVDAELAKTGQTIYEKNCASCHAFGAEKVGQVTPLEEILTDPHRLDSFTTMLVDKFHTFQKPPFDFEAYRKTYGYANTPLDGVWARAPYLHNGSVPTLWHLLQKPEDRPTQFYKGFNKYDYQKLGWISSGPDAESMGFLLKTSDPGNGNQGHTYGTELSEDEKRALLEYLKTI
ncbi:c-type cytochrome [Rubritalea tangerina]|uniref:C-type cytochrome n=1 Tax=Rubritalea tangerina TaxID=430798 RepID=A0ABW4ZFF2_9BACT